MGGLFDSPDPPNPIATAAAQTGTNVSTAVANANLGNVNQVTPQGNLTYNQTDTFNWTDPATGQTFSIPKFTATQTLSPTGQATFDQSQQAQYNLSALGAEQAARLRQQFGTSLGDSLTGAPAFGDVSTLSGAPQAQTEFGTAGDASTAFAASPDTQLGYEHGEDFSADRQRIEEGLLGRINPSLAIERNKYEQQLADQGIVYGSPAYENAMRNYAMQANDARFAAIAQGGAEQQRLSDIARQAGEFHNQAAQQAYYRRAKFNGAARTGSYAPDWEKEEALA